MFRHYRVILRELGINTLQSYTSISNAAVCNTIICEVIVNLLVVVQKNERCTEHVLKLSIEVNKLFVALQFNKTDDSMFK